MSGGVCERIRFTRELRFLSQAQLGRLIGLDGSAVSRMETGERRVAFEDAIAIALKLDVSLNWLAALSENPLSDSAGGATQYPTAQGERVGITVSRSA